ncbi:unnamed protein product [Orchesella dallaii]|uniref:Uncharacterized protein n=1 Tax=Orchesella dallaii TaxID=48710 RepID=A0ABP1RPY3_9HEXA
MHLASDYENIGLGLGPRLRSLSRTSIHQSSLKSDLLPSLHIERPEYNPIIPNRLSPPQPSTNSLDKYLASLPTGGWSQLPSPSTSRPSSQRGISRSRSSPYKASRFAR